MPLPNGRHRIYFWAHAPGILRYLAADSDDGRRYRVIDPLRPVLYHPHDRAAWLSRGDQSQPDSYGIYANHHLVQRDGKWHLFYTGVNSSHNGQQSHGPPRQVIMHAAADSIWA